jgi:hypothetical protein
MKTPKEHKEQRAVLTWLRNRGYFVYAIPNHKEQRAYEGAVSGMPDLQVVLEGGKVVWIEMKRSKGGRLSDKQKIVHAHLRRLGHTVIVGLGAKDAVEQFKDFTS